MNNVLNTKLSNVDASFRLTYPRKLCQTTRREDTDPEKKNFTHSIQE